MTKVFFSRRTWVHEYYLKWLMVCQIKAVVKKVVVTGVWAITKER